MPSYRINIPANIVISVEADSDEEALAKAAAFRSEIDEGLSYDYRDDQGEDSGHDMRIYTIDDAELSVEDIEEDEDLKFFQRS